MIRFAKKSDKPQIVSLWNNVFGDSAEAVEMFLDTHFICRNTLVYSNCDRIVSMLFLIEGKTVIMSAEYPSYYLYAACTDEDYRGQGLMSKLIKEAQTVAAERGYSYIFLLPAEDSLYQYYEKYGYRTLYGKCRIVISAETIKTATKSDLTKTHLNFQQLELLRKSAFSDISRFEWNGKAIDYSLRINKYYSGDSFQTCKGYALYSISDSILTVKEFAFHRNELSDFLSAVLTENDFSEAVIDLPVTAETDKYAFKSGMILPLSTEAEVALPENNRIYLGLTLD